MKFSFSTIGCPDFTWSEACSMAKDFGFSGVEIRGFGADLFAIQSNPFGAEELPETLAALQKMQLYIPCLATGCDLSDEAEWERTRQDILAYIDLAERLGTPYIRLLADRNANREGDVDDALILLRLKEVIPEAEAKDVTLLLETNGVYADTARLRDLLAQAASDNVAALWDMHHPYRFMGESADVTIQNLGAYIKHAHIKDSVMEGDRVVYKLMGEGDLPVKSFIDALASVKYDGYISLEWVKRYMPDLEEAGIVFPHFINYMSQYTDQHPQSGRLQTSLRGTGRYIWPKETMLDLTFPQILDRCAEEFPDQTAFKYTTLDYERTYAQFRDEADTFARALISLGVRPGDHVAIWAGNIPEWFITFWATVKIGAVVVTVNTAYKIYEAEYLLRQSDTHTLVLSDGSKDCDYNAIIKTLCPELETADKTKPLHLRKLPFLRNIITCQSQQKGCRTFGEVMALAGRTPIGEVYRRAQQINKHDVCNIQYTSGTTGFPKGVMLSHYNIVNNGKCIGDGMDFSTADRLLLHVPMFHCFGMVLAMTAAVTHCAAMVPIPSFSPKLGLEAVTSEKITAVHGVPTMFIAMLNHELFARTDFSHMRTGIMAGSPCPVKVMEDVLTKMRMTEITIVYGQTESSPGCTMSKSTDPVEVRVNTVGAAMFGVECGIADIKTGKLLPDDEDGEFVARGYNIMKGYYKMPQATSAVIDQDGWLHTGDIARRDGDGNYKITGRIKDMIIRGGENIYPKEIEDFLYTHPKVQDVQVIGVPSREYGEEILACIILKPSEPCGEEEIKQYVNAHMARHKMPRYVLFVDAFPMNAAGKIMKYKMRENAADKLGLKAAEPFKQA